MRSMELVGRERMEVAQQLSIWGEACDDDVSDVTDKLGVLVSLATFILNITMSLTPQRSSTKSEN
jgi:Eisosome component PIL1